MTNRTYDPEKFQLNIIRYKKDGLPFEVVIDPDAYLKFVQNQAQIEDVLQSEDIFADAQKGLSASTKDVQQVFSTAQEALTQIVQKGDVHLTTEFKRHVREKKQKQICTLILTNCVDPRTKLPIPQQRLDIALEKITLAIDEYKPAKEQVQKICKQLSEHLPLQFLQKTFYVTILPKYASKGLGVLQKYGDVTRKTWSVDGSLSCEITIPAGLENEFYESVNSITHATAEFVLCSKKEE